MLAARVREVCDRVGAHTRGRPHQEVRAELEMADPWWAIKHPVEAARVRRVLEAEDTDVDDDEDPVSQLVERFDDGPRWWGRRSARVVGVARRRTFDGWAHQVSISPWSDRLAHEIRKRCAGYDVRVVEHATRALRIPTASTSTSEQPSRGLAVAELAFSSNNQTDCDQHYRWPPADEMAIIAVLRCLASLVERPSTNSKRLA